MSAQHKSVTEYVFGPLKVRVLGLGVYTGGENLRAACDRLSVQELRAANSEAWKQKRASSKAMNRVANASVYGCTPHDRASQHYEVAGVVCRETWKRITRVTGDLT